SPDALPTREVRSNEPSPVTTKSALASAASKPTRDKSHSAPGVSWALAKNASPAPSPPAAPLPGSVASSGRPCRAITSARRSRPRSSSLSAAGPPHPHGCGTTLHGLPNKLAHTARRSPQGIELIGPQQRDAARSGALEDRGLVVEPAQIARHRHPQRPRHLHPLAQRFGR